jgi:hypothetical protein
VFDNFHSHSLHHENPNYLNIGPFDNSNPSGNSLP